jgi:hypothetical protein
MDTQLVIAQLRSHCPPFAGRVAGAAAWEALQESTTLAVPCAFVIPLGDEPGPRMSQNDVRQPLLDAWAVIAIFDNTGDERGQVSSHTFDTIRAALWQALLGWQPKTPDYNGTQYDGSHLLSINRARSFYQFEFSAYMEISKDDGWQEQFLVAQPEFTGANIRVDVIDPIALPLPGPDGRIEFIVNADFQEP